MTTPTATWSLTTPQLAQPVPTGRELLRGTQSKSDDAQLRRNVGEFVGNVFYGTLLRQMGSSKLKGKYFHGGRGEEVFRGQLNMELARRMGQSPGDPIAEKMYEAIQRQKAHTNPAASPGGYPLQAASDRGIPLQPEHAGGYELPSRRVGGFALDSIHRPAPSAAVESAVNPAETTVSGQ